MGWKEVGSGLERGREWVGKRLGVGWKEVGSGLERGVGSQARAGQGRAGQGAGQGRAGQALSTSRLHLYFNFGFGVFGEGFGI